MNKMSYKNLQIWLNKSSNDSEAKHLVLVNFSDYGLCVLSFMNSKSLVNCIFWNHQYFEKFEEEKNWGGGKKSTMGF